MIAGSLNLEEPWFVERAEFLVEEQQVHIYVSVRENAAFACPCCGGPTTRNGYEPNERIWRHGDCMFYPSYVHCRQPRVLCPKCGTKQVNAPFERKNSRFTLLFEGYAMLILADMPRAKAAEVLRCDEKSLATILNYWVDDAVKNRSLNDVERLAIDETSFHRGHSYVTVVIDADQRRVIDVEEGRDKTTIAAFTEKIEERGGDAKLISAVTSDMSKSYLPAIEENFPNAISIIDKFHVKQVLTNALDVVRKEEQKTAESKVALKDAALTIRNHRKKILAYFCYRITNAICEGINSMIQAAKRKARGFNTYRGFSSMIYLIAGKLELAVPSPF